MTTVDIDPILTATAVENLRRAGVHGVEVVTGDGGAGVPSHAPFDRIEATVGVWDLSPVWTDQLASAAYLEVSLWLRTELQASVAFRTTDNGLRIPALGLDDRHALVCEDHRSGGRLLHPTEGRQLRASTAGRRGCDPEFL